MSFKCPALYFVGVWVYDPEDISNDTVTPAAPAPPGLRANEPYPTADLLDQLSTLARPRLETDDHGNLETASDLSPS